MIIATTINKIRLSLKVFLPAMAALVVLTGCQSLNYKEVAYSVLRHNDCQRNEIEVYCTRYYRREYQEYERTRDELLQPRSTTPDLIGTTSSWRNTPSGLAES